MTTDALIERFNGMLGAGGVVVGEEATDRARGLGGRLGAPAAVLRPGSTDEVSAIVKVCHEARTPLIAWGGRTGLVSGGWADGALAVSMERMAAIESIEPTSSSMQVQAGCPLQAACEAAEAEGFFFPLDLGARGSATIGGNIATNAGGNRVLRYGMMRENVLGLEAVLADGTVIGQLSPLMKNNTGYDLKQLLIGSEGTLAIVTRAMLRLRPRPTSQDVAIVAVDDFDALPLLLRRLGGALGGRLTAFEVMWSDFYELVTTPPSKGRAPIAHGHPYFVLIESLGADAAADAASFEAVLAAALEDGEIVDAAIAKSQAERDAMWSLRDDVGQVARDGPVLTFDVSLTVAQMQGYIAEVAAALEAWRPGTRMLTFGHLGDGNLHLIISARRADHAEVDGIVYRPLHARHGSISAEHGIGLEKKDWLWVSRSPAEIAVMRSIKQAMDPLGILNPGKIF